jgi:hypothetical protein
MSRVVQAATTLSTVFIALGPHLSKSLPVEIVALTDRLQTATIAG